MNDSKASGIFDQAKGKIKQTVGEATNDQSLANEGAADQVKGHAKEAWGNVKDTASDLKHSHEAHNVRENITDAAEHAKDSINRGLDHLEHKANT
jgi:uncharacterized protein YjbJ (UPF0337 family)